VPAVIALVGAVIIFKARSSALATTAGAIGWALMVVLVTTALFRWPGQAGQGATAPVTPPPDAGARARGEGPGLFKAGARTWEEAFALEADPERGKQIVEEKQQAWKDVADT